MRQLTARPIRKVQAGALSGASATLLIFLVERLLKLKIDPALATAATAFLAALVSYLVKPADTDGVRPE